ncbi:MAG: winged helix DNA-binding domain-containing protein [Anaerolineae bacterium]|nr:winged helix DNA-binding domain-containing protein [Anaerolineae bacterium]
MLRITDQRIYSHQLEASTLQTPKEVVDWMGAVQSQDYAGARWGLGLRLPGFTDELIAAAFDRGEILRTHVMRPTWHFVTPEDIRWLQALTAPRVHALNAYMQRQTELDDDLLARGDEVIARALEGEHYLTRAELAEALAQAGIVAEKVRLAYMVMHAELNALICSGPRRGKQFTYALLDERAPQARQLDADEALVELTRRYFTSHGPALVQDFAWWSGLTVADGKAGLELAKDHLAEMEIDGKSYWYAADTPVVQDTPSNAYLLPPYDEYTVAYKDYDPVIDPANLKQAKNGVFGGAMMIHGRVMGYWRRTFRKGEALVQLEPFQPLTDAEAAAFDAALQRFGVFLEMPTVLV